MVQTLGADSPYENLGSITKAITLLHRYPKTKLSHKVFIVHLIDKQAITLLTIHSSDKTLSFAPEQVRSPRQTNKRPL